MKKAKTIKKEDGKRSYVDCAFCLNCKNWNTREGSALCNLKGKTFSELKMNYEKEHCGEIQFIIQPDEYL